MATKRKPSSCRMTPVERVRTGVPGLDGLIGGGFARNSTILIRGDTGTGKTNLCLQYLYKGAVEYDEPGVYLSFSESHENVCQHGMSFGWCIRDLASKEQLVVMRYEPHEVVGVIAEGGGTLRDTVESIGARRLVIDSLTAYEMVFENNYKANESILALFEMLHKWKATTLVTAEVPVTPQKSSGGRLGFLTDGILNLYHIRHNSCRKRGLEVIKMRDTMHDEYLHDLKIARNGLSIGGRLKYHGKRM